MGAKCSPDLSGLHGLQPFLISLTLPMGSLAFHCMALINHLGGGCGQVLLRGVVSHRRNKPNQTKPKQKTENILNHTKPPQKKDAFLISFMSASNSTNNRVRATQGREDRAPQHHQRTRDWQENFVQIYTKALSLAAISHFCLSISLLPCINTWAKPERHQGPLNALDTTRASQAHPLGSPLPNFYSLCF